MNFFRTSFLFRPCVSFGLLTTLALPTALALLSAPALSTDPAADCIAHKPYPAKLWVTVGDLQADRINPEGFPEVQKWAGRSAALELGERNSDGDVALLAATYIAIRQQDEPALKQLQIKALSAVGTENTRVDGHGNGESLALARNLPSLLVAAQLLGLQEDRQFRRWLSKLLHTKFGLQRRSLVSTHEHRANNWGTHAGAARIAIALFLNDTEELNRAAQVFRGWLGERSAYDGFRFGTDLSWQAARNTPGGVNPAGARIDGFDVDGVLPDDQRRGGSFSWPPAREPYVWEALQGAVLQAQLLHDNGYCAYQWGDKALLRAVRWLLETAEFLPEGDDIWVLPLIDRAYGTRYSTLVDLRTARPGKSIGFTRYTHTSGPLDK